MWFMTLHHKDGDRPMTEAQRYWDLERVQVHNLAAAVLLEQAPTAPAGRAARTLIPGAGGWDWWPAAGTGAGHE